MIFYFCMCSSAQFMFFFFAFLFIYLFIFPTVLYKKQDLMQEWLEMDLILKYHKKGREFSFA